MGKKVEELLVDIEERIRFFSELGIDIFSFSPSSGSPASASLISLKERIIHCQKCPLSQDRTNAIPGEGNLDAELMFVGEAPGYDEDIQARPFVGKAGQLLTRIIKAMHFKREDVYITNVVKCRPPKNRPPYRNEIEQCRPYLLEQIKLINPRIIVSLGKVATDFFVRSNLGMTRLRGNFQEFQNIQIMPTFHPSYLIRNEGNREIRRMVWEDMKKVMDFLGKA